MCKSYKYHCVVSSQALKQVTMGTYSRGQNMLKYSTSGTAVCVTVARKRMRSTQNLHLF